MTESSAAIIVMGDSDPINYCVDDHAVEQRRVAVALDKARILGKFRSVGVAKRATVVDVSGQAEPIVNYSSLPMSLNVVKTKKYLYREKIMLVGNGFNDEALMEKASELEFQGFRDVKVLANGRRSMWLRSKSAETDVKMTPSLYYVNAALALSGAASSTLDREYFFITIGNDIPKLHDYGVEYSMVSGQKYEEIVDDIKVLINDLLMKNEFSKLVFVLSSTDQEKYILANKEIANLENIWLVKGGISALNSAISTSKIPPVQQRTHRPSCYTR